MHEFSKVVAIVDTFDAMTTQRVYQGAVDTYPALKVMFSMKGEYENEMMEAFAVLMGPTGLLEL